MSLIRNASITLLATLTLVSGLARASEFKAAYVDIQRAVQEVDEGKAAKARLQTMADKKQKDFEKEQAALKLELEMYQKQKATMDDKAAGAKELELQKKMVDFQQKAEKLRVEMAESERKELGTIFPKLEQLLGQIAQREGLTMVFDRSSSGLAWAPTSLDLTNELIRMYNNQYKAAGAPTAPKKDGATPAPGPAPKTDAPKP
ncbi:MAG: OmpH family outer membrane protein [Myxococcaceae bacterium]